MHKKIRDTLFFLICFTLIFNNIPEPIQMNFIGGPVGSKLVFYPLFIGLLYTAYCEWRQRNVLLLKDKALKFLIIYVAVTFLSLVLGLTFYPFYNDILNGPVAQIEKLPKVLDLLNSYGISVEAKALIPFWMVARMIKGFFLEILYTFGGAYMIFCWYQYDWQKAFIVLGSALCVSIGVIFTYSIFLEVPYLAGYSAFAKILSTINPYIHTIMNDGKWWPPLLWKGQLRSIFAEPSYFGIYTAFAMPFLWYKDIKEKNIVWPIVTTIMVFLLFLTKARTAFMLHIGGISLLVIFTMLCMRNKVTMRKLGVVIMCSVLAFVISNFFMANFMQNSKSTMNVSITKSMTAYVDSNATSLANPDKRSNRARYSIMEADFRIGLDYPILGVGRGLRHGYIPQYLPEKGKQNGEVKMWLSFREKLGILKSGFPDLGEYTVRFCETGILGLIVYLAPVLLLIFSMSKRLMKREFAHILEYVVFLVSLLGIMASGIGDTINITYCYWVLLGLGYAICFGKDSESRY